VLQFLLFWPVFSVLFATRECVIVRGVPAATRLRSAMVAFDRVWQKLHERLDNASMALMEG
jgi:hypothetical protein